MKKAIVYLLLFSSVIGLFACKSKDVKESKEKSSYDYNKELLYGGVMAWTPKGIYYLDQDFLRFISNDGKRETLCSKTECNHQNVDCEAYLDADQIFYFNNHLCYSKADDSVLKTNFYQMDWKGQERKKFASFDFSKDFENEQNRTDFNYAVSWKVSGKDYVQAYAFGDNQSYKEKIYWSDLNHPQNSKELKIEAGSNGTLWKIEGDWILFVSLNEDKTFQIWGYHNKTDEQRVLVSRTSNKDDNYGAIGMKLIGDELYWYEKGFGFYRKNIKSDIGSDRKELVFPIEENALNGYGVIVKDYMIISNMFEGDKGIFFYSYDGKLLQSIPVKEKNYQYAMETEDKVFFVDISSKSIVPAAYVEKDKIKEGNAKIVLIKNK